MNMDTPNGTKQNKVFKGYLYIKEGPYFYTAISKILVTPKD